MSVTTMKMMFRKAKSEATFDVKDVADDKLQSSLVLKKTNSLKNLISSSSTKKKNAMGDHHHKSSSMRNLLRRSKNKKETTEDDGAVMTAKPQQEKKKKSRRLSGKAVSNSLRNLFKKENDEGEWSPASTKVPLIVLEASTRTAELTESHEDDASNEGESLTDTCLTVTPTRPILIEEQQEEIGAMLEDDESKEEEEPEDEPEAEEDAVFQDGGYALVPMPPTIPREALLDAIFDEDISGSETETETVPGGIVVDAETEPVVKMESDTETVPEDAVVETEPVLEADTVDETEPVVDDDQVHDQVEWQFMESDPSEEMTPVEAKQDNEMELKKHWVIEEALKVIEEVEETEDDDEDKDADEASNTVDEMGVELVPEESFPAADTRDSILLAKFMKTSSSGKSFPVATVVVSMVVLLGVGLVVAGAYHAGLFAFENGKFELPSWDLLAFELPTMELSGMEVPTMNFSGLKSMDIRGLPMLDRDDVAELIGKVRGELEGVFQFLAASLGGAEEEADKVTRRVTSHVLGDVCKGAYCGFA